MDNRGDLPSPKQSETTPTRKPLRNLYSIDPIAQIAHYAGIEEGYIPKVFELRLGPIDRLRNFQTQIVSNIRRNYEQGVIEAVQRGINALHLKGVKVESFLNDRSDQVLTQK